MRSDSWLKTSIMAKRGLAKGSGWQAPRALDRGARRLSLCLRALCQAGARDQSRRRGQAGRVRLGNMVDPKYTMGASVLKKYLVS